VSEPVYAELAGGRQSVEAANVPPDAGHVITGASVSLTVTVNEQLPGLPDASVAEHVTVVVPFGNTLPEGGLQTTVGIVGGQLSVAGGVVYITMAEQSPVSVDTVTGLGHGPTEGA
jgi:hypothetical protein